MNHLPPKVASKLEKLKNAELEKIYFGIIKNQPKEMVQEKEDEVIERKPEKKVIIEKENGEACEKRKMEKLKFYVKEISKMLKLVEELIEN